jgi:signal transduction histidine kinase
MILAHAATATGMGLAYFCACWVALSIDVANGAASVWPASGLLLGVLLLIDRRWIPSVLAGSLAGGVAANMAVGFEAATSIGYTLINLAEGSTARWLVRRWAPGAWRLRQPSDVLAVMGCGAAAGAAGAVAAGTLAVATGHADWFQVFGTWLGSDTAGVAIVAPVILATADAVRGDSRPWHARQAAEAGLIVAAVMSVAAWVYLAKQPSPLDQLTNPLLLLPLIAWAAIRLETLGAAWAVFLVNAFVLAGAAIGAGPFVGFASESAVNIVLQARVGVTSLVALSLGSAVGAARRSAAIHRQLAAQLQTARDAERGRLSHELHDDVAQRLAALKMQLQIAQMHVGVPDAAGGLASVALIDELLGSVRSLAHSLRPVPFDPGQLVPALRALARREGIRGGFSVLVDTPPHDPSLSHDVELACYRVVREALANVVKHAQARHVAVSLAMQRTGLTITVVDDGRGFDVTQTTRQAVLDGHLGIVGMRERLNRLGGRLTVDSRRGAGTTVNCSLPIGAAA